MVLDAPIPMPPNQEPPDIESSAEDLAPLADSLKEAERVVVRLRVRTRKAAGAGRLPSIYLSGVEVWLDVPATGKKGRGYLIDLEQAVLPGIRRPVERRAGEWILSRIGKLDRHPEILNAIRYAITKEREVLE